MAHARGPDRYGHHAGADKPSGGCDHGSIQGSLLLINDHTRREPADRTIRRSVEMGSSASRVAVVTGGSGGVGRRTAERLGAEDMAVVTGFAGNPAASIWLHESAP